MLITLFHIILRHEAGNCIRAFSFQARSNKRRYPSCLRNHNLRRSSGGVRKEIIGEKMAKYNDMTDEEYDALDEELTRTIPKLGPSGTGFLSQREMRFL